MMRMRVLTETDLTDAVLDVLDDVAVTCVQVHRGSLVDPPGDVVEAHVARESVDGLVARLRGLGVEARGAITLDEVATWISQPALRADEEVPGSAADAMVWPSIVQQAYDDSELNWTFMGFIVLATLLAAVAIVTDSPILTVGAMVIGPEFGAVVAVSLAVVRRRPRLLRLALRTLAVGFTVAILVTSAASWVARQLGWVTTAAVTRNRAATSFIYHPDHWSFIVALIAGAAGVLAMTSSRRGGLTGVFISVTTIPAAANVGVGLALGEWAEVRGSVVQLVVNILGMAVAGWLTLQSQKQVWTRVSRRRLARRRSVGGEIVSRYRP